MIKFQFPENKSTSHIILAADMGGTKVNIALFNSTARNPKILFKEKYFSSDYASFNDILKDFFKKNPSPTPDCICIGVAGPVINDIAKFTNLHWEISIKGIRKATGIQKVALLNDLEATAYGFAYLTKKEFHPLRSAKNDMKGNMVLIAPGTGLGIAGLSQHANGHSILSSEGGHSEYAPRSNDDNLLYAHLKAKYKIVSWEHIVSGKGIKNIYTFLRDIKKMKEEKWLLNMFKTGDMAAVISEEAFKKKSAICKHTMKIFIENLARISSSMALIFKATGGVYLCGGIPPKIIDLIEESNFCKQFLSSDRMNQLLQEIPVHIVLNEETALWGAAYYGTHGIS
ncbi:MAG: glucokinase [Bacteroidetes bacterium]|nr:glucokinase [Bacteroidota bacterium]